jgi:hypothetical protein
MIAAETFARTILVTINRVVFVEMFDNVNDYTVLIQRCGGWDSNPRIPKEQGYRKHTMFSSRALSKLHTLS